MNSLRRGGEVQYVFHLDLSLFESPLFIFRVPKHRYTNMGLNGVKNMSKQGYWKQWYRYHFDRYRYQLSTSSRYRYWFEWYRCRLPTASWYQYHSTGTGTPYGFFPKKCGILHFSLIFLPQTFSNSSHIKNPP